MTQAAGKRRGGSRSARSDLADRFLESFSLGGVRRLGRLAGRSPDVDGDSSDGGPGRPDRRDGVPPSVLAATVALGQALEAEPGLLDAVRSAGAIAVLRVPSAGWVEPVRSALSACVMPGLSVQDGNFADAASFHGTDGGSCLLFARDGTDRSQRPDRGNRAIAAAVQAGCPVVGISHDPARLLPADLTRAADVRLDVGPLGPAEIDRVVSFASGTVPTSLLASDLARLCEPSDLMLALRPGRNPDAAVEGLATLIRARRGTAARGGRGLEQMFGYGEAKAWGLRLAAELRAWRQGTLPFREIEAALLLSGPPGTGKSQFAAAVATTTDLPLHVGSLAQWQAARDGHLGHTLGAMRDFFDRLGREPCVALIDEIDSVGDRSSFSSSHRDYSTQVVNALLECLSNTCSEREVVLIATTNNPLHIDPAILRSGRIGRHIALALPGPDDLRGIIRQYAAPQAIDDAALPALVGLARGRSGADIEAAARTARSVARAAGREVGPDDLASALAGAGPVLAPEFRMRVALHEAGHGVAAIRQGRSGPIELSMRPSGGTARIGGPEGVSLTEDELDSDLLILLAGRAAEQVLLGSVSAGAEGDLHRATRLATLMETRLGFSRRHPLAVLGEGEDLDLARTPWLIEPVHARLSSAYEAALELIRREEATVSRIGLALADRGFLDDGDLRALARSALGDVGIA
ncbi:AAA family ATPase [Methylobacterium sp. R2-1]|uniref:AAA family ATPase n=1 Tax=Methylobacterium sp. R2-1 TaxID=2587064 RepID=UPI001607DFE1|nr:AAA family ATPase [Methylobacterium sp. R2-1]MBB2961917.1 hypothetical protein [Methylobacterium sp. R2-1]